MSASASTPPTKDSPFVFTLSDTLKRLDAARPEPAGPFGTHVQLGNPAMDTIGLHMMRLSPRVRTAPYRATTNNIYAIVKGSGATTVDGERFEWSRGDVIAAPAWRPHFHEAADGCAHVPRQRRAGDAAARLSARRGAEASRALMLPLPHPGRACARPSASCWGGEQVCVGSLPSSCRGAVLR